MTRSAYLGYMGMLVADLDGIPSPHVTVSAELMFYVALDLTPLPLMIYDAILASERARRKSDCVKCTAGGGAFCDTRAVDPQWSATDDKCHDARSKVCEKLFITYSGDLE